MLVQSAHRLSISREEDGLGSTYHAVGAKIRLLDILCLLYRLLAYYLHPVAIRVKHKGDMPHSAVCQLLLELVASILNAPTGSLDVVYTDAGMAEATVGLLVAIVDGELRVVLCAVVVCKLNQALTIKDGIPVGKSLGPVVAQEVEVELVIGELELLDNAHSEEFVELHWWGGMAVSMAGPGDESSRCVSLIPDSLGSLTRILEYGVSPTMLRAN